MSEKGLLEKEKRIENLENEIELTETRLKELKDEYSSLKGHVPQQKITNHSWKWSIYMVLGFAFISSMFYLLCISLDYEDVTTFIPELFFDTEFSYFAILSFYLIITIIVIQPDKLANYQTIALFLGFWCSHWLIYDWSWWAIKGGFSLLSESFWQDSFGFAALIPDPPMWLFLTEALLGGLMTLYTFSIPDRYIKLIPPIIWLFAIYGNATLGSLLGLNLIGIYITGIIFVTVAFLFAAFFAYKKIKMGLPEKFSSIKELKKQFTLRNWKINPLGIPSIIIIAIILIMMHLWLAFIPVIGLFIGMIAWYFVPFLYILYKATNAKKYNRIYKIFMALICVGIIALLWIMFSLI